MKTKSLKQIEKERYRNEIIKNERNRILKLIDKRIKDLEAMLECDEEEMWETSDINGDEAEAILKKLKELRLEINKEKEQEGK